MGHWSRKIMEALGAEWVMGTMGARWEWGEQEQGGNRDTEKQHRDWGGWRQGNQSRVGWGIRSRTRTRTQGTGGDRGNGAVDRGTRSRVEALGARQA